MSTNLLAKFHYAKHLLSFYENGPELLLNLIFKKKIKTTKFNGLVITGGGRSLLLEIVDEIFSKSVYNPNFLEIKRGDCVMDVGANVGVFSLFASKKGAKKIYAIEPVANNIKLINKNFLINKIENTTVIPVAVSSRVGQVCLCRKSYDPHGYLVSKKSKNIHKNTISVESLTLKQLIESYHIKKIDFLKIDCEGCEGEIIKSTPKDVWKIVNKISLEYHNNLSRTSHKEILKCFRNLEFKTEIKQIDRNLGYIYAWK